MLDTIDTIGVSIGDHYYTECHIQWWNLSQVTIKSIKEIKFYLNPKVHWNSFFKSVTFYNLNVLNRFRSSLPKTFLYEIIDNFYSLFSLKMSFVKSKRFSERHIISWYRCWCWYLCHRIVSQTYKTALHLFDVRFCVSLTLDITSVVEKFYRFLYLIYCHINCLANQRIGNKSLILWKNHWKYYTLIFIKNKILP